MIKVDNTRIVKSLRWPLREVWPEIEDEEAETEFLEKLVEKIQKDYWKKLRKSDLEVTINRLLK